MNKIEKILNWLIIAYFAFRIFGASYIIKAKESIYFVFLFVLPILLFVLQVVVVKSRFLEVPNTNKLLPYEYLEAGDWWRFFWLLLMIWPIASQYLWGFYFFSFLAFIIFLVLSITISIEIYKKRKITTFLIGFIVFAGFLLYMEKDVFVIHYGVPIIGHFFEKPEYNAKYRINVQSENSNTKFKAIADIYVKERTERDDEAGYDYFDNPRSRYHTVREIWIKNIYLHNNVVIKIKEQDEPLSMGDSVFVQDTNGKSWYVEVLQEPIQ